MCFSVENNFKDKNEFNPLWFGGGHRKFGKSEGAMDASLVYSTALSGLYMSSSTSSFNSSS